MIDSRNSQSRSILLMIAGAKGAVASTVAVAVTAMQKAPETVLNSLTTRNSFPYVGPPQAIHFAGWDHRPDELARCIKRHGVLPDRFWEPYRSDIDDTVFIEPAPSDQSLEAQVEHLMQDMQDFKNKTSNAVPVLVNLLPACRQMALDRFTSLSRLCSEIDPADFPDLAYVIAAIRSGIPVANFTPNFFEVPLIVREAVKQNVPISGCDGKTGQTYLKVALASALKARNLYVDGWYSLNLLGNTDGKNLMDPERAAGKKANKTNLLDDILGYPVGQRYGEPSHMVHIDYYPPRGDAKEAWDVIDFHGIFDLPMSIRLNLLGRDSILAAPVVLDLARWMAALKMAGRAGLIPELAFYYKKPLGENPPINFQDQVFRLQALEKECDNKVTKVS
ncbi:MAG: inositol-3-phosphate synthase [Deltaproteobacteria bacterium]|nr:inositol-3-phosphate synthase [Deltaproteobacteria bacterium]